MGEVNMEPREGYAMILRWNRNRIQSESDQPAIHVWAGRAASDETGGFVGIQVICITRFFGCKTDHRRKRKHSAVG